MFKRFTLLLPAPASGWEVWSCPSGTACVRQGGGARGLPEEIPGRFMSGLPARACRTFSLRIPSQDPKTARQLALAQLEKRGLAASPAEETPFDCHLIRLAEGGAILSVDVAVPSAVSDVIALKPAALLAAARCYALPDDSLILTEEQGDLVLWATYRGTVVHSHIISAGRGQWEQVVAEVRITRLTLSQLGVLPLVAGLELRGAFTEGEAAPLGPALGLPVRLGPHPEPDAARAAKAGGTRLLPAHGRTGHSRGKHSVKWLAGAAAAALVVLWWSVQARDLSLLEKQAAGLEESMEASAGTGAAEKLLRENARATQERWQGLRMALDPRRYPLIQLNSLTRCLGGDGVLLSRFESKGPELAVSGTAQSARGAYGFYSAVSSDPELRIYTWSMVQPVLAGNGTATFQIKGKMR